MSNVEQNPDGDQNPLDAIRENLARKVVEWDPQPGDAVVGYIHQIEYVNTENGDFPVVHVRDDTDTITTVACGRRKLRSTLARMKAQPGDAVGIQFQGKVTAKKGGNDYFGYRVDVVRIGERKPDEALRDEDDLGLVSGAAATDASDEKSSAVDVWNQHGQDDDDDEGDTEQQAAF